MSLESSAIWLEDIVGGRCLTVCWWWDATNATRGDIELWTLVFQHSARDNSSTAIKALVSGALHLPMLTS